MDQTSSNARSTHVSIFTKAFQAQSFGIAMWKGTKDRSVIHKQDAPEFKLALARKRS